MRDIDGASPHLAVKLQELTPHLHAEQRVKVAQRFVHEECRRLADDRPAKSDPLALAPAQLLWVPLQLVGYAKQLGHAPDFAVLLVLRRAAHAQRKSEVRLHRHVRI